MKNQFGASAKLAIGTVLFTVIIFFQNCSDISVSKLSQNAVACVDAINTTALFVRGYTPVSNGIPNTSQIHFEILVDTGGDTFARSGYIADWTMDGQSPQTSSVYEIDTPPNCVDHVVQAKIELCGTEYTIATIPTVMKFGTGGACTPPPPIDPNTVPPSVPGSGTAPVIGENICGPGELTEENWIPGFSPQEPPQNPACFGVVNWQRNSSGAYDRITNPSGAGTIRRDMRLNTQMTSGCRVGWESEAGLNADTFFSLRIDTLADYSGLANKLTFRNGADGAQNGSRPAQVTISECVGDFGVTELDPTIIPPNPRYRYRRANLGPMVGKCGLGNLVASDLGGTIEWAVRSRAEIQALEGSADYLVVNGPCLLERGKTYYINIIQSNPDNIFETICHDRWRVQGCSTPGSCPPEPPAERVHCGVEIIID